MLIKSFVNFLYQFLWAGKENKEKTKIQPLLRGSLPAVR